MSTARDINRIMQSKPTMEGAGVRLNRAFGFYEVPLFDPFLLLDDFHSNNPDDYIAGFPWHPHRGIETVTYMVHGKVQHGDSMGNRGIIQSGDIQWMTAGSGIIHEEMPQQNGGILWGFQLWVNLPAKSKMMNPRYRDIKSSEIPVTKAEGGVEVRVIAGMFDGAKGPVRDIVCEPEYLDVMIPSGGRLDHPVNEEHTVFAYVMEGSGAAGPGERPVQDRHIVSFGAGDRVVMGAGDAGLRFLLISGKPIGEPVAWSGPIVMNTDQELKTAFQEYRDGTFLKT